jgi:hypothetical protein
MAAYTLRVLVLLGVASIGSNFEGIREPSAEKMIKNGVLHIGPEAGEVTYKIHFLGMWNISNGPAMAMFSPIAFASHNEFYDMWRPGERASQGVKDVAETGDTTELWEELKSLQKAGKVYDFNKTGIVAHNENVSIIVHLNYEFRLVSLISMIFPSPDWFVGVYSLDLYSHETGRWSTYRKLNLYAWDAGTDSGTNFTSPNYPTDPRQNISLLVADHLDSSFPLQLECYPEMCYVPKFGEVIIELDYEDEKKDDDCEALGKQIYTFEFLSYWTDKSQPNHPLDGNGYFKDLVITTHDSSYLLWELGTTIFRPHEKYGIKTYKREDSSPAISHLEDYVEVDMYHHYVSGVANLEPSPDWFVGFSRIDLCAGYFWKDGPIVIPLRPFDSGNRTGETWMEPGDVNMEREKIKRITTDTEGAFYNRFRQHIKPLGYIVLTRKKS